MPIESDLQSFLGGAKAGDLDLAADEITELTPENDPLPFDVSWHEAFARWSSNDGAGLSGSVILIFSDTPQVAAESCGAKKVFHLGTADVVQPGAYIVGRTPNGNAWRLENSGVDHQSNCNLVTNAGFPSQYALVLGHAKGHLLVLPNGIDGESIKLVIDVGGTPLDEAIVVKHLKTFAEECLNGTEFRSNIWEDASKWMPVKEAEKEIQKLLVCGLRTAFIGHSVLAETKLSNGRSDIFILSKNPSDARRSVLELKVARSKNSSGNDVAENTVREHLMDGITQALEYKKNLGATYACLCGYDMRETKAKKIIEDVQKSCDENDVKLHVFGIYNASKTVREAVGDVVKQH